MQTYQGCCLGCVSSVHSALNRWCTCACVCVHVVVLQVSAREAALVEAEEALKQQSQHMEAAAQLTQREAEVRSPQCCANHFRALASRPS